MDTNFNGTNLSTKGFTTYGVTKPLNPKQRQEIIDVAKRQGAIQAYKKFTGNQLTIRGVVTGTSPSNLTDNLETLAGFLYSDDDVALIPSDQSDRYWNVQFLEEVEVRRTESLALIDLVFTANDPFGYAVTADDSDNTITTLDDTFVIANSGHFYAYPVIT
ncbi:MAG: phage tail family protein, partial [Candidatus Omnitrophica bacterium]|nr:phage tail family protein [Candidatus Omnitrophota bacterium]